MLLLPASERSLNKLFAGDALGTVIDQLVLLAMPTLALTVAGLGAAQVSVLTASQWMPAVLLGNRFGALADARDRRVVLGTAGLMSCAGAAAMAFVAQVDPSLRLAWLLAASLLFAAGGTLHAVASAASVPRLAVDVAIPEAVSAQACVRNVARIAGLALAGPAVQCLGAISGVLAAAVFSLAKSFVARSIPESASDESVRKMAMQDTRSAWRISLTNRILRRLLIANATMNAGGAMVVGAFFAFAYDVVRVSPFSVGVMLFVGGSSAILASRRTGRLMARFPARSLCTATGLTAGAAVWLVPASAWLPTLPTLFVYEALFSAAATVFAISFAVVRQRLVPSHLLGKLVAVSSTSAAAAMVAGSLVGALLIDRAGLLVAICAGCAFSSAGAMSLIGLARTDEDADLREAAATP